MPRYSPIFASALMSVALWGCGGAEEVKPVQGPGGVNQAGGAGGIDMPGAGGAAGMPGGGMPGGGAPAMGAGGDSKPAAASGSRSAQDLLQFVPEDLQIAAGANFIALSDSSTPFGAQLLEQFKPVLTLLAQAGIKVEQIEQLWTGTNRSKGELVTCVRTRSNYDASSVSKGLGTVGKTEKIGHASVHTLPALGEINNVVAYVDGKTFLIGRLSTVTAALGNPKPGAIRFGLEAMAQPQAYYWIAGDDGSSQRLNIKGFEGTEWLVEGSPKPRGMAKCLAKASGEGQGSMGGPDGMPGMRGMPPGGPGGAPGAGHGARGFRAFQGPPAGGHAAPGGGAMPPGGMMPPGAMQGQGDSAGVSKPVEIAVGWCFDTEAAATQVETTLLDIIKAIQSAQQPQQGGMRRGGMMPPGGMPPGGMPPGGMPPGGANPAAGHKAEMIRPLLQAAGPPQGHAAPGGMPGAGMPGSPGSDNDPNLTLVHVTRDKVNVKLRYNVTLDDTATVGKLIAKAIGASGASAVNDGLFEGTLTLLNTAMQKWESEKPDQLVGTQKVGNISIRGGYSWMTQLLPYVGHADLYSTLNFKKNWLEPPNRKAAMTVIPAFLNPADPRTTWDGYPTPGAALSHFAGMSGIENGRNEVAAELPRSDPRAGIFGYDHIARHDEITDGTSQTIMIVGTGEVAAPWIQGGGATIRGARQPYFDKYTGLGSKGLSKPGTFVLFADGSARMISADIDPEVFKAMCTMHGAEEIDMNKIARGP